MKNKADLFYFTGTGNSKRALSIAGEILRKSGFEVSLRSIAKPAVPENDCAWYGFCFPVYSLAIPRIAYRFLKGLPNAAGNNKTFLFMTGGAENDAGWSLIEGRKVLEKKGYNVVYTELVHMPDNWIPFDDPPEPAEAKEILENAEKLVVSSVGRMLKNEVYHKPLDVKKFGYLPSLFLHFIFRNAGVKRLWMFFRTNNNCNGCGTCEKACPTRSIKLVDGRPKWSRTCEQCMRCFHICPRKAIGQFESIGKGSKRARYFEPNFKPLAE